jgi:hypothetical protein
LPPVDPDEEYLSPADYWEINRPVRVAESRGRPASTLACGDYLILHPLLTLAEWEALMHERIPTEAHVDGLGLHHVAETTVGARMRADELRGVITFPCGFPEFERWARKVGISIPAVLVAGYGEVREREREAIPSVPLNFPTVEVSAVAPRKRLTETGVDDDLNARALEIAKEMRAAGGIWPTRNDVAKRLSAETGRPEETVLRRIRKTW